MPGRGKHIITNFPKINLSQKKKGKKKKVSTFGKIQPIKVAKLGNYLK